jgi:ABC-type multidrug transport system fused ATPase/permease subunit
MTGAEVIPQIAWEQAVYVSLFIVLIVVLINWFSKQSDKWQQFIEASNEKWRAFSEKQRNENNCAMGDVNESLSNLTRTTGDLARSVEEMRSDINAHDQQAKKTVANDGQ